MNISPVTIFILPGSEPGGPHGSSIDDIQRSLFGPLQGVAGIREQLSGLTARLPQPPDAMLEQEIPFDVPTELLTTVQHIVAAYLTPAEEKLRRLIALTPEQLHQEWLAARKASPSPSAD
jgi:hypothetical protein